MSNDNKIDRRNFLKSTAGVVASCTCASSLAASLTSCESYTALETPSQGIEKKVNIDTDLTFPFPLTKATFKKKGYGAKITFPDVNYGIPLILVRMDENTIDCYSTLCPHDNCFGNDVSAPTGYFDSPEGYKAFRLIKCACHGSRFDPFQDGKAVTGPAEKPLKKFPTSFDKETNILTIKF